MNAPIRPTPEEVLTIVTDLAGVPLDMLQSSTQQRHIGQVRAAAAHLLRTRCGLLVKHVAPLLGRSDQTVCECSRKARRALASGGRIAELIEQTELILAREAAARAGVNHTASPVPRTLPVLGLPHWRRSANLTQDQLATRAHVARETIVRLENGRRASRAVALRVAAALSIAPSTLTGQAELDAVRGETYRTCKTCGVLKPLAGFVPILWNQKSTDFNKRLWTSTEFERQPSPAWPPSSRGSVEDVGIGAGAN